MKKRLFLSLFALQFCAFSVHAETRPLPVVASFSILGDMVKQVGGDDVVVQTFVGPDGDAHAYEATPSDVKKLTESKLLFVNGLGLEGWMQRLASAAQFKGKILVASEGVKPRTMKSEDAAKPVEITDPHAWQDLSNGVIYVHNIAKALEDAIPDKAGAIAERARVYEAKITSLDQKTRQDFASVPVAKRHIITSHDAFGYFGAAYGIEFSAPVGLSTDAEPSAAGIVKLLQQMKQEKIKTVFLENMASPRLARQLAKDGKAKLGAALYSDALSPAQGDAPTYLAMFENNVPKMKQAMLENGD